MTYEQYDKAIQINSDMNIIYELQNTLGNAKNGGYLSAIKVEKWDGDLVEHCKVLKHVIVPENIMEKFERILWEELEIIKEEFRKL